MDMDIKDLEDLANDQHADLQQKPVEKKEQAIDSPSTPLPEKESLLK